MFSIWVVELCFHTNTFLPSGERCNYPSSAPGPQTGGLNQSKPYWELSSLPEHISELALLPAIPALHSQFHRESVPRTCRRCSRLQLWSWVPPPWPLQHPPSSWAPCTAPGTALPGASCTIFIAGTASGIAAIKILSSKQQSKDQPILKSVLPLTFRLILKLTKVNGVQSLMNHPSKSKTLYTR